MNKKDNAITIYPDAVLKTTQSGPTSRRKALKAVLAGSAAVTTGSVPAKWVSPVVDSVLLPAHATTSGSVAENWFGSAIAPISNISMNSPQQVDRLFASAPEKESMSGTIVDRITGFLVEPAFAQDITPSASLCVIRKSTGGIEATYQYQVGTYVVNYIGMGQLGNQFALEPDCDSSVFRGDDIPVTFTLMVDGTIMYDLEFPDVGVRQGNIPVARCTLGRQNCDGNLGGGSAGDD